ncbi:MAG: hypothetical protein KBB54_03775 [Candidatus Pacebacteria bacterium]|nr:hypothetical protein [Candidatus Paceibacterota bacterium]
MENISNNKVENKKDYPPLTLFPESSKITLEQIREKMGNDKKIIVCDFYVDQIDSIGGSKVEPFGLVVENIINIDHHAPIGSMERQVSSATLAIEFVKREGVLPDAETVINHTDCDSVLSSSIIRGMLPPEERFSDAAIAADHTGEPNEIADLLQALQEKRDVGYSLHHLSQLLGNAPIDEEVQKLVNKRLHEREEAKGLVENGMFKTIGKVAYAETEAKFDGSFLPALLPESWVIILSYPYKENGAIVPYQYETKIRLGKNVPAGFTLQQLKLGETAIHWGGRWNAGSNKRAGGSTLSAEECANIIAEKLEKL